MAFGEGFGRGGFYTRPPDLDLVDQAAGGDEVHPYIQNQLGNVWAQTHRAGSRQTGEGACPTVKNQ